MRAALMGMGQPHARLEYINSAMPDGHVSRTMACFAEMLRSGAQSPLRQETANNIFHVVRVCPPRDFVLEPYMACDPLILTYSIGPL